jgi:hypothetical protein
MPSLLLWIGVNLSAANHPPEPAWWNVQVESSPDRAPARKKEWVHRLETCRPEHRAGLTFLLKYLPRRDLETMTTEAMAAHIELAYRARGTVPWGASLPEEIFLDDVLPYASVAEPRQSLRAASTRPVVGSLLARPAKILPVISEKRRFLHRSSFIRSTTYCPNRARDCL